MRPILGASLTSGATFAQAAHAYWGSVFPRVGLELERWRRRAREIPDRALRTQALEALQKRGNMEGAAAFATFVGQEHRAAVVRATVAFQTAYNHLDTLSEQAGPIGAAEIRSLHEALTAATAARTYRTSDADPYLRALVQTCQNALGELPSYSIVAPAAMRAAGRVVSFQAFNRRERAEMQHWGREQTPAGSHLRWWETAASGGSSLGVHAMIAAAAEPGISQARVDALECAYFPWIGALHSMLDHLVDIEEDARSGQPNLIELYGSTAETARRMALLAERALERARALEPLHRHESIVAAMASFYLAAPQARVGEAAAVTRAVLDVFGGLAWPALAVFRVRRGVDGTLRAASQAAGQVSASGEGPSAQGQSIRRASSAAPRSIGPLRLTGS